MNARFSELRNNINHRLAELSKRMRRLEGRIESRFKWLMGTPNNHVDYNNSHANHHSTDHALRLSGFPTPY